MGGLMVLVWPVVAVVATAGLAGVLTALWAGAVQRRGLEWRLREAMARAHRAERDARRLRMASEQPLEGLPIDWQAFDEERRRWESSDDRRHP